ncbi:glucose-1-phosphate thymidylyltransferase RfbA [Kiloniella laminariae]|uniref:Glucose-1-phosphate thymidylyltransferase n=1 Tax=Kiloniella laminariae TaxID=454162 RepID=A0ABT4LHE1_9PROT|nr:glucose-1-phosphate thymidylyltransferase RfbA [Kiloniella laminariae]MCZ4280517.1 glucose-1-phosphate thymidylyltransferase RfbA [Kiloniella laminariae]
MIRRGIILAGGTGTRLKPLTDVVCKQLLPVYDKPMLHYPLATLMLLGIKEILIISTPKDLPAIKANLGDGSDYGISLQYAEQKEPRGLPDAFIIGADFIGQEPVCLILGDNILYWGQLKMVWGDCLNLTEGAYIVGARTRNPEQFGVIEYDTDNNVLSIEEKPENPKSSIAAIGLYFYDNQVVKLARELEPSPRGELEITDLNNVYLKAGKLKATFLSRGSTWLDAGTVTSLMDASNFFKIIEDRQGIKICCLEEVAFNMKYITKEQLRKKATQYQKSQYGEYLIKLLY